MSLHTQQDGVPTNAPAIEPKPTRAEAGEAVRVRLRWAGDTPTREGLAGTPERVVRSYEEFFAG